MRIRIEVNGSVVTATLGDSPASRDLVSILPLVVALDDSASSGKIAYLPMRLSTEDVGLGADPLAGDIAYHVPKGAIVICCRDIGHSSDLVLLGHLDSGIEVFTEPAHLKATVKLIV